MPAQPIRWEAHDGGGEERSADWFIALGVAAICIALTSMLLGNVFFGVLIIMAAIVWGLMAREPRRSVECEISDEGIRVGNHFYSFESIIAFWIEEKGSKPLLLVDTIKFMTPNLMIPLEDADPTLVRAYLVERVSEVPMKEPTAHKILELIGL